MTEDLNPATWASDTGVEYRAREVSAHSDCTGCCFDQDSPLAKELCSRAPCMPAKRPDCRSVIFERIP